MTGFTWRKPKTGRPCHTVKRYS